MATNAGVQSQPVGVETKAAAPAPDQQNQQPSTQQPTQNQQPAAPPNPKDAPWTRDWADRGIEDPDGRLGLYMREIQQPYVTRLEQQVQTSREIGDHFTGWQTTDGVQVTPQQHAQLAAGILKGMMENPAEAYLNLGVMFGVIDEEGNWLLDEGAGEEEPAEQGPPQYSSLEDLDPARARKMDEFFAAQEQAKQDALLDSVIAKYKQSDPNFDEELFLSSLVRFEGDEEQAIRFYRRYAKPPKEPGNPIPTLGDGSNPPSNPRHGSLRSAAASLATKLNS